MKWPDPSKVKMSLSGMKETDYSKKNHVTPFHIKVDVSMMKTSGFIFTIRGIIFTG